jgi:hypothetical protein
VLFLIFAPIAEEILKSIPLLYIYRQPEFTYLVDGAVYGFASGIGFSITENILYINLFQGEALTMAISRVISSCLMHGSATALIGISLGRFRFQRSFGRGLLVIGWIMAILLHSFFNSIVVFFFPEGSLVMATILGLGGLGVVAWVVYLGLREERKWLVESLDQNMVDLLNSELTLDEQEWLTDILNSQAGVSFGEVRASQFYESLHQVLEPIAKQFPGKSEILENIVLLQAQIGIKRKVLKKLYYSKRRVSIEREILEMQEEVKQLRKEAGECMMIYIQCVFNKEGEEIIHCLENAEKCVRG